MKKGWEHRRSSWVPLSCSPDLWSQGTIPQPKHHLSEEERRNCVLLLGCSLQCRREGIEAPPPAIGCGETSGVSAEPILGCPSVGLANIPRTPAAQNFPRWLMKFRWLSAASWLKVSGKWDFSDVKNELLTKPVVTKGSDCDMGWKFLEELFR